MGAYRWNDPIGSDSEIYPEIGSLNLSLIHILSKPFKMGLTEVTNAQYELFCPEHKSLRGKNGFSSEADEAVVFVTYQDAVAFCDWLTRKE